MSTDTKWILGAVVGTWVAMLTVVVTPASGVRADLRDTRIVLDGRMDRLENRLDGFDARLRAVEIAFGKVDQRLATLERAIIPAAGAD